MTRKLLSLTFVLHETFFLVYHRYYLIDPKALLYFLPNSLLVRDLHEHNKYFDKVQLLV